jgi:hypothetical protein
MNISPKYIGTKHSHCINWNCTWKKKKEILPNNTEGLLIWHSEPPFAASASELKIALIPLPFSRKQLILLKCLIQLLWLLRKTYCWSQSQSGAKQALRINFGRALALAFL